MALAASPIVSLSPCYHQARHICNTLTFFGVSTSNLKAGWWAAMAPFVTLHALCNLLYA